MHLQAQVGKTSPERTVTEGGLVLGYTQLTLSGMTTSLCLGFLVRLRPEGRCVEPEREGVEGLALQRRRGIRVCVA